MGARLEAQFEGHLLHTAKFLQQIPSRAQPLLVEPFLGAAPERGLRVAGELASGDFQVPRQPHRAITRIPRPLAPLGNVANIHPRHIVANSLPFRGPPSQAV